MSDFKSRLETEHSELVEKHEKLTSFLDSDKVHNVGDSQRALLKVQASAMQTYIQCLIERLKAL
jgi:hypothetical protein